MTEQELPIRLPNKKKRDGFINEIESISGQSLHKCYQCGKCSAGCPFVSDMKVKPNQVIRFLQLGLFQELKGDSIWFCVGCFVCGANCPKGVDLARIMEAVRELFLRNRVDRIDPTDLTPEELEDIPNIALVCAFRKQIG